MFQPKKHSWQLWLSRILWLSVIFSAISAFFKQDWWLLIMSIFTLGLMIAPLILEKKLAVRLPISFEIILTAFIYASVFLGSANDFYEKYHWWDIILHAEAGFFTGFIGFTLLFLFFSENKIKAVPSLIAFFAFSVAMMIASVWEIFEYFMDTLFGLKMQRSGLPDTMGDLILGAFGALVVAILGYVYLKFNQKNWVQKMIDELIEENPQYRN